MFSNKESQNNNNNLINFMKCTPIKVKRDNNFTFESSTIKSSVEARKNETYKRKEYKKNAELDKNITKDQNSNYKYSGDSLKGVELNKTFFSILKNKIFSNKKNKDKIYYQNEFCKKYCGEKLFKNLDLNQRYYIKKSGESIIHNQGCPLFKIKPKKARTNSNPMSYRELRKNSVEKDLTLLDLSLAVNRASSIVSNIKTTRASSQTKDKLFKIPNNKNNKNTQNESIRREYEIKVQKNSTNNDNSNSDLINSVEFNKIKNRTIVR